LIKAPAQFLEAKEPDSHCNGFSIERQLQALEEQQQGDLLSQSSLTKYISSYFHSMNSSMSDSQFSEAKS